MTREEAKVLVRRVIMEEFTRETRNVCAEFELEIASGRVDPKAYDREHGINTPEDLRQVVEVMREFVAHVERF